MPMRHALLLASVLAGLTTGSETAHAAPTVDARDEAAERRLPEVEVEADAPASLERSSSAGGRLGLSLRETPASVDIIDQEALRARGETTFVEAFDNVPGLSTGACFGVFCISARGFSSSLAFPILNSLISKGLSVPHRCENRYII